MQTFPAHQTLLPEYIALNAKWHSNRLALVCDDQRLTWKELSSRVNKFANFLQDRGVQKGDRVAVLMSNGTPMFEALLGCMAAGAVSVPINISVASSAVIVMAKDSGSEVLLCSHDQSTRLVDDGFENELKALEIGLYEVKTDADGGEALFNDLLKAVDNAPDTSPKVVLSSHDLLNIIYSSGTTGDPKGIVHTHQGRRDWAQDLALALRVHSHAVTMLNIGLYSNISWAGILTTLIMGGTCVVHKKFDAMAFLDAVQNEKVTHCAMVPVQYQRILAVLDQQQFDLSSCVGMTSCGSPLFESTKKQLFDHFACGIIELYGLTEGVITTLSPEDAEGRWSSVGKPMPGVDIKIVGEHGREVPVGQNGEIVSRSRVTMPCYYNRNEATESAKWTDEDGYIWMRTGDVGQLDDEGFLYIVDRKKDMIISGGQNIYPQDIEAVIVDHPQVEEVAVIGAASGKWGETPIALIVPKATTKTKSGMVFDCEDVKNWSNERLGRQQKIADAIEVTELPRNANGKILKRELRKRYENKKYD